MPNYKNVRPTAVPEGLRNPFTIYPNAAPGKGKFVEGRLNKGMVTTIDAADIDPGALQLARNARFRFDKALRRPGTKLFDPPKPDPNLVLATMFFKKNNGETYFLRFTHNTIHYIAGGVWTVVVSDPGPPASVLTGTDSDRYQGVTVLDRFVFANNGKDPLHEFDTATLSHKILSPGHKATGILTLTANPLNGETVTVGGKTYTFQTVLTNVNGNVLIGANASSSLDNLIAAIMVGVGAGVIYAAATTPHPTVKAEIAPGDTILITALTPGIAGNGLATSETLTNGSWGGPNLTGGSDPMNTNFRFITGFANRVVGANLGGLTPNSAMIGWSGDNNISEWDPLIDESAGRTPLVDSTSDLGDPIMGVFAFTNIMIILREQSVVLANKQPIQSNPFYFYTAIPGLGCDCPDSACITLDGLTWVDKRSGSVWNYTPNGELKRIGLSIEKDLMKGLDDTKLVFGTYNKTENEYTVYIPQVGFSGVIGWTYNFRTDAWSQDTYEGLTSADDVDFAGALITIDDLGDVPIDSLAGTIDDLSPTDEIRQLRVFGRSDGEITIEDINTYTDVPLPGSDNVGGIFKTVFVSKALCLPTDDQYFAETRLEYMSFAPAPMKLYFSKDGGVNFPAIAEKTITPTSEVIGIPRLFRRVRQLKTRRFAWMLEVSDGQFDLLGYEVHVYASGESRT